MAVACASATIAGLGRSPAQRGCGFADSDMGEAMRTAAKLPPQQVAPAQIVADGEVLLQLVLIAHGSQGFIGCDAGVGDFLR